MAINIQGTGWLTRTAYGSKKLNRSAEYASRTTLCGLGKLDGLFSYPVKSFGRFDEVSQRVCYVTALAMQDAGLDYSKDWKQNVGLIGTDLYGCEQANFNYFEDYMEGGRTMARANLFIYTLPSSPLAEAAVHFGLQGPLLYLRNQDESVGSLLTAAQRMIDEGQAERMLVYELTDDLAQCHVIGPAN